MTIQVPLVIVVVAVVVANVRALVKGDTAIRWQAPNFCRRRRRRQCWPSLRDVRRLY